MVKEDERQARTPVPGVFPGGCLVLVPSKAQTPEALIAALSAKALLPRLVRDEPAVMEALSEMGAGRRVLVVVEPKKWKRLAELVDALHTFYPGVLRWQFTGQADAQARLTMLQCPQGGGHSEASVLEGDAPVGQILGRRRPVDDLIVKVPGRTLTTREVVTQQELTMLLGPAPGEAG